MSNRFRDPMMRREYEGAMAAYRTRHRSLFLADGTRRRSPNYGSSFAQSFWSGYDGLPRNWDAASKRTLEYAHFRAGQDARKQENAMIRIDLQDLDRRLLADISDDMGHPWEAYESFAGPETYHMVWSPAANRAGLVYVGSGSDGRTAWTDAESPEEALRLYVDDEITG